MDLTEGVVELYNPKRDRSLEPLLEGLIKGRNLHGEGISMLRSTEKDFMIDLPKFLKQERIQVTDHHLKRPPSNHDRVVEVYIGNYRRKRDWETFFQEPAATEYAGKDELDSAIVLDNLLNLPATKLLYSVSTENDKLVRGVS
jgi:hypothetical protein